MKSMLILISQAMTNTINEVGASNVSKHCADFNIVNVVDIPHSSLGANRENFKSEAGFHFKFRQRPYQSQMAKSSLYPTRSKRYK